MAEPIKTAILLHGSGGNDQDYFWFEDTKKFLEEHGFEVWWPLLPHPEKMELSEVLGFVEQNLPTLSSETIIIGHSSACPLILCWLEHLKQHVKQVVLVSGFYHSIDNEGSSERMLPKHGLNWDRIKASAKEIVLVNSDNDPWGCDDTQARPVAEKLGATFVLAEGQGHMGSHFFKQPYRKHQLLKQLLQVV